MRDFYEKVLEAVSYHTGFEETQILHSRLEVCTDARYLLIHFLSEHLKCNEIVYLTGLPKQTVSQICNQYDQRAKFKYSIRECERKIRNELIQNDMLVGN